MRQRYYSARTHTYTAVVTTELRTRHFILHSIKMGSVNTIKHGIQTVFYDTH